MELLKETFLQLMMAIHVASNQDVENCIAAAVHKWPVPVLLIPDGSTTLKYDAFRASKVASCTSGMEALEVQLARTPFVFACRRHILREWFVQYNAKIQNFCLPNILLNTAIIPEAVFQSCSPENLASLLKKLMLNNGCREEQIVAVELVSKLLCPCDKTMHHLPSGVAALTGFIK